MNRAGRYVFPTLWVLALDALSVAVWTYIFFAVVFIEPVGALLGALFPSYAWLANLRIVAIVAVLAALALKYGPAKFGLILGYVAFFPLLVLVWKLPAALVWVGSWVFGLAFVNLFISLFTDVRYRLVSAAAYLLSFFTLVFASERITLTIALAVMGGAIAASYVKAFVDAFRTPAVLKAYQRVFGFVGQMYSSTDEKLDPPGKRLIEIPPDAVERYVERLQSQVIANVACLYVADKLRRYQGSEASLITGIIRNVLLIFLTWISFSAMYFATVKLDPSNVSNSASMDWFDYVYMSFDNSVFSSSGSAIPVGMAARAVSMFQRFLSAMVVLIFLTLLFEARNRRHARVLDETIAVVERNGAAIAESIATDFKYNTIEDAMDDLKSLKAALYGFILRLSNSLKS